MKKKLGLFLVVSLFVMAMPVATQAQYGGGPSVGLPGSFSSGGGRGNRTIPAPIAAFGGRVLGAFTSTQEETQAKINSLKTQVIELIKQLIAMLQQQLASTSISENN